MFVAINVRNLPKERATTECIPSARARCDKGTHLHSKMSMLGLINKTFIQ